MTWTLRATDGPALATVIVYVIGWPAIAVVGDAVFEIARSARAATGELTVDELLLSAGSVTLPVTVAVLLSTLAGSRPAASGADTVTVATAPFASVPSEQPTVPALIPQVPAVVVTVAAEKAGGSTSVTVTFGAGLGPPLVTVRV